MWFESISSPSSLDSESNFKAPDVYNIHINHASLTLKKFHLALKCSMTPPLCSSLKAVYSSEDCKKWAYCYYNKGFSSLLLEEDQPGLGCTMAGFNRAELVVV